MGTSNKSGCKTAAVMNLLGKGRAGEGGAGEQAELLPQVTGPDVPRDIETITGEILDAKRTGGEAILTIGRGLMEAKALLSHGEWLPWLTEKVEFSEKAAQNFMRIARNYSNPQALADLGATKALMLLALPQEARDEFLVEPHLINGEEKSVIDMTSRELEAALKERDAALKAAEQAKADQSAAEQARQKMEQDITMARSLLEAAQAERDAAVEKSQNQQEAFQAAEREVSRLEKELEELRSRPVDVAVETDTAAIEAARKEAEERMQAKLDKAKKAQAKAEEGRKAAEDAKAAAEQGLERARAEAQAVREQAVKAEKKAALASNEDLALFRVLFDQTQDLANKLGGVLLKFRNKDPETAAGLARSMVALSRRIEEVARG